ncbi:MAG: hypothetical protein Q4B26_06120 [Eubacteriales bacterium]|nr:hypothetical protein [Eubacteriales bacterium]
MTYFEYIRSLSDEDLAYFIDFIQPEITLISLAMERTLKGRGTRDKWDPSSASTCRLDGTRRRMYFTLNQDFDQLMHDLDNEENPNWNI